MTFEEMPVKTQLAITSAFRKYSARTGAGSADRPTYIAGFLAALQFVSDELEKQPNLGVTL